jgi:hypothetical protein
MTNQEIINSLFDSYKFTDAMPDGVRAVIIQSKQEVLINILKKTGKYSFGTLILIKIVFFLKKCGVGATAAKIYFITTATAIAITGSAVVGVAIIGYHSLRENNAIEIKTPVTAPVEEPVVKEEIKTAAPAIHYALEITPFKVKAGIAEESSRFTARLHGALTSAGAKSAAVLSQSGTDFNAKYVINGTLAKIGDKYYIGVKLVDPSNSRIITQINRTAEGKEGIDLAAGEIAKELAGYLK